MFLCYIQREIDGYDDYVGDNYASFVGRINIHNLCKVFCSFCN